MRAWAILGMAGAAVSLATVALCLWLARREEPRRGLHWVSFLGSRKAPRRVRATFRLGLAIGGACYGAFASAWALHADGARAELAGVLLAGSAVALVTLATCPMDVRPRAHVAGALSYFGLATAGAIVFAVPPRTPAEVIVLAGAIAGGAILVPLFSISFVHTAGRSLAEIERYFLDETTANRAVRLLQHPAIGVTGAILFLTARTVFVA
jgi:hypothetical protein